MKKMVVLLVVVVLLIAAIFAGYKLIRKQILDGPGMEYDPKNYPDEEPIDGLNKEAILDGPDGTSTHAFAGSKDSAEVDLLDIEQMPKTAVRQPDAYFQYAIYINVDKPASGEGEMDYSAIMKYLKKEKPFIYATLENTTPENAAACRQAMQDAYDNA